MGKLLENPQFIRIAITVAMGTFAFLVVVMVGYFLWRKLKDDMRSESLTAESATRISENNAAFSLAAYEGVIRKLKEQEKELERLRKSERDRAYESASTSEAILSNLGSGVLLFNPAGLVKQANPAGRSLLGFASPTGLHTRDVFRGVEQVRLPIAMQADDSAASLIGLSDAQCLVTAIDLAVKRGLSFRRLEADYTCPDGTKRVIGITISPVKGPGGEPLGAAVLVSDLTEITRLSQQIRLRESMASLGEMAAGIAHEFKNSLATISGYGQMLAADGDEFASKITAETDSLSRIVNDFLNFARPQGLAREPVDLVPILRECALESQVELKLEMEHCVVKGDPTALRQALSNLLRNSAEAMLPGQQAGVEVSAQEAGGVWRLVLKDNGPGIPQDVLPRIFVPFFTTKAKGTGLGLALVHRLVTEQGGTIQVESSPQGTAFTLALPLG